MHPPTPAAVWLNTSCPAGALDLTVGRDYRDGGKYLSGSLGPLEWYSRAVSAAEVTQLYQYHAMRFTGVLCTSG